MSADTGKWLIVLGAALVVIGGIIYFFHNNFSWFGNLPGDIKVERENFRFYFPITTMLIVSLLINVLFRIYRWLN